MNEEAKEIKMPNFIVSLKNKKAVNRLTDEQAGRLFKLLFEYSDNKNIKIDDNQYENIVLMMFDTMTPVIDEGRSKYIRKVERNRKNGKNGGRPKETQNNPLGFSETQNNPLETNETKVNKTKQSICVSKDTHIYFDSTENSPDVAVPSGTPQANKKPTYKEMREYYEQMVGRDDAVLVDDFDRECRTANDYSNWQERLLKYEG